MMDSEISMPQEGWLMRTLGSLGLIMRLRRETVTRVWLKGNPYELERGWSNEHGRHTYQWHDAALKPVGPLYLHEDMARAQFGSWL